MPGRRLAPVEVLTLGVSAAAFAAIVVALLPVRREERREQVVVGIDEAGFAKNLVGAMLDELLGPPEAMGAPGMANRVECTSNVRRLVAVIESVSVTRYPNRGGPNLLLYAMQRAEREDDGALRILFCPGDVGETLRAAGGAAAYRDLDLSRRDTYDSLTSYAAYDFPRSGCDVKRGTAQKVALIADDSADHHDGRGFVVGYTGGTARWRDKVADWKIDAAEEVEIGPGSAVPELRCLAAE